MHRLPAARGNSERPLRRSARRCWGFSPVLIALLLPQAVLAMAADEWLARMDAALRGTDYQGTLIYIDGERMDMMRIFHSAATDTERLVTLSGPHREVIRQGRNVTCIGLGRPATIYDGAGLAALRPVVHAARNGQSSHYRLELGPSERAAGRAAQILEVRASDGFRYGYRFWLDLETGFPLRVSLLDSDGEPLEDLAFTDIQLGVAPSPEQLEAESGQALRRVSLPTPSIDETTQALDSPTNGKAVPAGFVLRGHSRNEQGEEHWVFSDGLASVSAYLRPAHGLGDRDDVSRSGSVHARLIQSEGRRVYVIGKVPAATIEHLARGVIEGRITPRSD